MKRTILILLTVITTQAIAQQDQHTVDSLKKKLDSYTLSDTGKVRLLIQLSYSVRYSSMPASLDYADRAMELSTQLNWPKGKALSWRELGNYYYSLSDYLKALDCFQKALAIADSLHDKLLEASLYFNCANIYADLEEYEKAIMYYNQFKQAAIKNGKPRELMIALVNLGVIATEQNDYDTAMDYNREALKLATDMNDRSIMASIYNTMGVVCKKQKKYSLAIEYYEKSIADAKATGNINVEATVLNSIGRVKFYLADYTAAEKYSLQSLELAKKTGSLEWEMNANENLSNVYGEMQQPAKALMHYKNFIALRDSIFNDEKKTEIAKKEMQFEFDKKEALTKAETEKQKALAAAEISRQQVIKNAAMGVAGILVLAGTFSFIFYKRRRDAEKEKVESVFKAQVSDTEMKALRAQMNPHFIFNSLNSISDYVNRNDTKTADIYLAKFAKLMRQILENSDKKEVTLSDDLMVLENYMQLEAMRLRNKFSYSITVDDTIDPGNTMIPPLILQPFVENSIWHGIATKQGEGKISIRIMKQDGMIYCTVEDNGVGRKNTTGHNTGEKKSLGMKITQSRIDILNRIRKSSGEIKLSDLAEGLRVEVSLPFIPNY